MKLVNKLRRLHLLEPLAAGPLYLGLIAAQGVVYQFMHELIHLVSKAGSLSEAEVMLIVLGLIDVVMIANLLVMVIVGGYETFVSRLDLEGHPDQPEWLSPRQRRRPQGQAGDGADRHFLDPSPQDLHQRRPDRRPRHPLAGGDPCPLPRFRLHAIAMTDKVMTQTLALQHQQH